MTSDQNPRTADDSELKRIRKEARDEAIKETEAKLKRKVQETFQCVVCLHIPKEGHITQCQNGHLLCEECTTKNNGNSCPNCRAPPGQLAGNKRIRALAVEQLIESVDLTFPCKHPNCEFSASKNDTIMHEKKCEYRMVPCPDNCCKQRQQWPLCGLLEHMRNGKEIHQMGEKGYKRKFKTKIGGGSHGWRCCFFNYKNQPFAAKTLKVDGIYYTYMYILGDLEEAKKFKVTISIGEGRPSGLVHTGQIFPIDAKKEDIIKEESGVLSFSPIGMGATFFEDVDENQKVLQVHFKISKEELNGGDVCKFSHYPCGPFSLLLRT